MEVETASSITLVTICSMMEASDCEVAILLDFGFRKSSNSAILALFKSDAVGEWWLNYTYKDPSKCALCRNLHILFTNEIMVSQNSHYSRTWQKSLKLGNWALPLLGSKVKEFTLLHAFTNARTKVSQFWCVAFSYCTSETSDSNRYLFCNNACWILINVSHHCRHWTLSSDPKTHQTVSVAAHLQWKPPTGW